MGAVQSIGTGAIASRVGCAVQQGCANNSSLVGCAYSRETVTGNPQNVPVDNYAATPTLMPTPMLPTKFAPTPAGESAFVYDLVTGMRHYAWIKYL